MTPMNGRAVALVRTRRLVKEYRGTADRAAPRVVALRGIDLEVRRGEFLIITGRSGAGKTTLVNCLTRLDRNTSGEVWVGERAVHGMSMEAAARWRRRNVGIVFQTFELIPSLSLLNNVVLPMNLAGCYSPRERRRRALALLEDVGIAEHALKPPTAISGGQQQRVAIARALANDPPLIIADEPTGSLDSATASQVLDVFEALLSRGKTVVLVTHDRDIARRGSRTITLVDGLVADRKEAL